MTDTRTPEQVAEEEAHDFLRLLDESARMSPPARAVAIVRFDRAIKAARWAQHVEDCIDCRCIVADPYCTCDKRDRLRREWEEASNGR